MTKFRIQKTVEVEADSMEKAWEKLEKEFEYMYPENGAPMIAVHPKYSDMTTWNLEESK